MTLGQFDGILEANVYGVHVPGRDGRAGMAAIVARDTLDLTALHDYLAAQLPEYARPVFLRIRQEIDVTTTFKQKKMDLVEQGYDPAHHPGPDLFQRSAAQGVRPDGRRAVRSHQCRRGAAVNRRCTATSHPHDVLAFWRAAGPSKWFKKDAGFDAEITARFLAHL